MARLASLGYEMLFVLAIFTNRHFCRRHRRQRTIDVSTLLSALSAFCLLGYFTISWHYYGQTIAMRAWHLRLLTFSNRPVSFTRCCLRFIVASLSALLGGVGFYGPLSIKITFFA